MSGPRIESNETPLGHKCTVYLLVFSNSVLEGLLRWEALTRCSILFRHGLVWPLAPTTDEIFTSADNIWMPIILQLRLDSSLPLKKTHHWESVLSWHVLKSVDVDGKYTGTEGNIFQNWTWCVHPLQTNWFLQQNLTHNSRIRCFMCRCLCPSNTTNDIKSI
jgi:hypothetical protein